MTKVDLDLYYIMTNSYTKFQVNISKDSREKSGKLKCDGRTDWQTDGLTDRSRRTASKLRVPRQAGRGLIKYLVWNFMKAVSVPFQGVHRFWGIIFPEISLIEIPWIRFPDRIRTKPVSFTTKMLKDIIKFQWYALFLQANSTWYFME